MCQSRRLHCELEIVNFGNEILLLAILQTQEVLVLDLILLLLEELGHRAINVTLFSSRGPHRRGASSAPASQQLPTSRPAHFICACISETANLKMCQSQLTGSSL